MKDKQQLVRNSTKAIIGVSLAALLTTGCTQMLTHIQFDDEATRVGSLITTGVELCRNHSYMDRGEANRFLAAMEERLSYVVYDEALWGQVKQETVTRFKSDSASQQKKGCAYIANETVEATATMIQANQRMAASRSRDLVDISNGLQQLGSSLSGTPSYQIPNYQSSQITSPKIEPINANQSNVTPLYSADDCIGSSVNGMCYGTVLPNAVPTGYCRGAFVSGQCSGAITPN